MDKSQEISENPCENVKKPKENPAKICEKPQKPAETHLVQFLSYYKSLGIFDNEAEYKLFAETSQRDLPITFRLNTLQFHKKIH